MKTVLKIVLLSIIIISNMSFTYAVSEPLSSPVNVLMTIDSDVATINSQTYKLDQAPVLINSRTMVPIRFITEALGLDISWESKTRSVLIEKETQTVRLYVDQSTAEVNSKLIYIDTPPTIINDRTLVPVRFISEVLGYQVSWKENTKEVSISNTLRNENDLDFSIGDQTYDYALEVLRMVNIERIAVGTQPLTLSNELMKVATLKSQDIVDHNYFSHTSPTYGGLRDLLTHFSINYTNAGENLATGQKTPTTVVQAWMNSEGHRANILNPKFNQIGIGVVEGGKYGGFTWTQLFTN